jgi:putative redox protein
MKTVSINAVRAEGFHIDVSAGDFTMIVDQPPAGGGNNDGPNPLQYTMASLGACMVTIGTIIANQERLDIRGMSCKVDADIETKVLLGKATEPRAGFTDIRMEINIDADMTAEEKHAFVERIEARCPISDNLTNATNVSFTIK